ncbi:hypothetical protein [Enterococcus casseliflavus]|uniref:hypothetical protein n=1 Tax=Enterococcus casseliflavus TaxID=37734 RepID=UPI0039A71486
MEYLRLFHFRNQHGKTKYDKGKIYVSRESEDSPILPLEIKNFFEKHATKVLDSNRTQNVRFRNKNAIFLDYMDSLFDSLESFDKNSVYLAEKFATSLKKPPRKSFYLIFFDACIHGDECFAILTMEARQGVQVNDDRFDLVEEILPDKESRLKKAAVIYREYSQIFKSGNELPVDEDDMPIRHAVLIDSQTNTGDSAISEYFIANFLDSENMADNPSAVAKILLSSITKTVSPFLKDGYRKKQIKNSLKTKFSSEQKSSFKDVINYLSDFLSIEKLNTKSLDWDSLSELAYSNAKLENKTITKTFTAKVTRIPKTILKDKKDGKSIYLSVSEKSLENNDVIIKEDDEYFILKVKRNLVSYTKKN